jgi:hypothetical protein
VWHIQPWDALYHLPMGNDSVPLIYGEFAQATCVARKWRTRWLQSSLDLFPVQAPGQNNHRLTPCSAIVCVRPSAFSVLQFPFVLFLVFGFENCFGVTGYARNSISADCIVFDGQKHSLGGAEVGSTSF